MNTPESNTRITDAAQAPHAELLTLRGADAADFASNQLASDVRALQPSQWQWTAWLDAAGRVRMLGMLWRLDDGLSLLLRGGRARALAEDLRRFVLRANVEITAESTRCLQPGGAAAAGSVGGDGDRVRLGLGERSLCIVAQEQDVDNRDWQALLHADIAAGRPWLPDATLGQLLPPALGLHRLGAVTLGKGCYPGQEMVNRLHTRGGHKYALTHLRTSRRCQPGESLRDDAQHIGSVLTCAGNDVLAVLHDDAMPAWPDVEIVQRFSA